MESCSPRNVAPGLSAAYSISYAFIRSTMMSEPYAALERPDVAATRSTAWTSWPLLIANLRSAYVESTPHPTLSPLKGERKEWKVSLLFFWLRATQPAQLFAGQRSHQGAEPVRQRRLGACFKCDLHGLGKIFVRPGQVDEVEFSQRVTVGAAVSFGDRRIQHADAARCRRGGDVPAGRGFHGAGDNHHAARLQTGQDAHGFQCDRLDLGVIGDHDEDGLAVRCDFSG